MNFFPGMPIIPNNMVPNNISDNFLNYMNDMFNRYNDLENRVKKLEERIYKLEHIDNMNSNPTPDNSMYML